MVVAGLGALGLYNYQQLPIDAVPDITNVQVQVNTEASGYSPLEAEQRITFPIETAITRIPRLDYTRSISRYGLSQVTVVFKDGTDIYWARQMINERITEVREQLPRGIEPRMGPLPPASVKYSCIPSPHRKAVTSVQWICVQYRTG